MEDHRGEDGAAPPRNFLAFPPWFRRFFSQVKSEIFIALVTSSITHERRLRGREAEGMLWRTVGAANFSRNRSVYMCWRAGQRRYSRPVVIFSSKITKSNARPDYRKHRHANRRNSLDTRSGTVLKLATRYISIYCALECYNFIWRDYHADLRIVSGKKTFHIQWTCTTSENY